MKTSRSRTRQRIVLVTGFEAFGGDATNPSGEIALALDGREIAGRTIVGAVLPCVFGTSRRELERLLRLHRPEVTVCLGLAAGRTEITPERIAINVDDARIRDNEGRQPVDRPVVKGAPAAYWSTLPVKAIVASLRDQGWPASVSQTAGTFVCNHVFYGLMHALRRRGGRGGFVHVPRAAVPNVRGEEPAWPLSSLIAAIEVVIEVAVRKSRDVKHRGGSVH